MNNQPTPYKHPALAKAVDYCINHGFTLIIDDEWMNAEAMQKEYPFVRLATPQDVNDLKEKRCLCINMKTATKCQTWNIKNFTAYMNEEYVTFESKYFIINKTIQENTYKPLRDITNKDLHGQEFTR